ncbi:MAG: hypothetical protein PHO78_00785 [Methanomicrobium sp.]|nr:hypothetical protein [Methanomicrobium sp.]
MILNNLLNKKEHIINIKLNLDRCKCFLKKKVIAKNSTHVSEGFSDTLSIEVEIIKKCMQTVLTKQLLRIRL